MPTFTLVFLTALALTTLTKLWLAARHIQHIQSHRNAVPQAFSEHIALEAHQKAADYSSTKTRVNIVNILLDTLILLAFTLGGGLQFLSDFWASHFNPGIWHGMALIVSALVITSLLEIPLSLFRTFVIEARFGFNKVTPALFFADMFKQLLVGALIGLPFLAGVLWLMDRMGENWWLYVWLAWMAFNLLVLAIYPTFIAPFFNKFTPLEDAVLKTRIEQFLQKCGFKAEGLFVMDGSRRSSHGNAYFTGFGKSKRIVFFDTLLANLTHDEIEAVLAHELGHFKRRHIIKRIVWMFSLSLGFLWLLGWLMDKSWFYEGLNVSTQSTGMALILFFMVIPVFTFLLQPLGSFYSRKHEFEADQYAAQTASPQDMVRALVKLYKDNASTLTPDPLHSVFYDSHPPAAIRIARLQNAAHNS